MHATEGLREALEALPLAIEDVRVTSGAVALASYGNEPRPTSTVVLRGKGHSGYGEHLGWTEAEHAGFRERSATLGAGTWRLDKWARGLASFPPYDRAALEAAAIDLALRQRGLSLLELARSAPSPVRYVLSLGRLEDPVAEAERMGSEDLELKIDVDPAWPDETWHRIVDFGRVAVIDFKLGGQTADHERAHGFVEYAWVEDPQPGPVPWSPSLLTRLSVDGPVTSVAALDSSVPLPAAVNVKAARMGGVLEAISCLERCRRRGLVSYIGGMFEVGVGRKQSLVLATLACPDGPNDIAPLVVEGSRPPRLLAEGSAPGFAGDPAS